MKHLSIIFASVFLCWGCAATRPGAVPGPDASAPDESPIRISTAYRTEPLTLARLAPDTALAMSGIVQMIRGEKSTLKNLTVAPGISLTEPGVALESFDWTGLTILDRSETAVIKGQSWETKTMAVLTFGLGPWKALVLTEAITTTSASGVVLNRASVRPLSPAQPRVVAWFVPKAAFLAAIASDNALPVWELMKLANAMGVPIGTGQPQTKEPHLAVVFVLDRLEPGDKVSGSMSIDFAPAGMWARKVSARDGVGFPVVMMDVDVPLNKASAEHFVHVTWHPTDASRTNGRDRDIPIGRFSTAKALIESSWVAEDHPASMASSASSAESASSAREGIAKSSHRRLLNLNTREAAASVQTQLKKLGYDAGVIDGIFGKISKAALAKFKKAKALGEDANWDMAVQSVLFGPNGP